MADVTDSGARSLAREDPSQAVVAAQVTAQTGDIGLGLNPLVGYGTTDFIAGLMKVGERLIADPWLGLETNVTLLQRLVAAGTGQAEVRPQAGDKRFADSLRDSNPFYKSLKQSYLAWVEAAERWLDRSGLEGANSARARIAVELLIDALAPTNTLLGNPAALRKLLETGGASALRGIGHMIDDVLVRGGLPAQVDARRFTVGGNLALSSGAVVHTSNVMELIQYTPKTKQVHSRPLLIIPPQINKFYLYDLAPNPQHDRIPHRRWATSIRGELAQSLCAA